MGLLGKKKLKKIPYDVVSYVLIEAEAIKDAAKKEAGTYSTAKKQSQMSDSFLQFASFAKSGAYNLSNYYAVSMLNMLV